MLRPMSSTLPDQVGGPTGPASGGGPSRFGEFASDALRYWEPRRLVYNTVLMAVVCAHVVAGWPGARVFLSWDVLFMFFILAVLANIAYCACYAVDLFVQFSGVRGEWRRHRWWLLAIGTAFAAVIAHFFTLGMLGSGPHR